MSRDDRSRGHVQQKQDAQATREVVKKESASTAVVADEASAAAVADAAGALGSAVGGALALQLRDEGALTADLARYVAFKESFHAPPSFVRPDKYNTK
mgnify:CR=1 FL=1